jgi:hypothetical protein
MAVDMSRYTFVQSGVKDHVTIELIPGELFTYWHPEDGIVDRDPGTGIVEREKLVVNQGALSVVDLTPHIGLMSNSLETAGTPYEGQFFWSQVEGLLAEAGVTGGLLALNGADVPAFAHYAMGDRKQVHTNFLYGISLEEGSPIYRARLDLSRLPQSGF